MPKHDHNYDQPFSRAHEQAPQRLPRASSPQARAAERERWRQQGARAAWERPPMRLRTPLSRTAALTLAAFDGAGGPTTAGSADDPTRRANPPSARLRSSGEEHRASNPEAEVRILSGALTTPWPRRARRAPAKRVHGGSSPPGVLSINEAQQRPLSRFWPSIGGLEGFAQRSDP